MVLLSYQTFLWRYHELWQMMMLMMLMQDVNLGREDVVKPMYSKDVSSAIRTCNVSASSKVDLVTCLSCV